ncbi:MAG: carboxypeptidase-like regulatory domain-containing protein, partial [Candidatus Symbiothrix sp.]|nr:carboxypeptidase-like regulatory domain-containing protein [Candidatus Symbiothrix sp.]
MYKKILLQIIVFIFTYTVANAAVPVSGKIIEESTGNPLEYANIVLLSLPDSAFVSGTTSGEGGLFQFDKVNSGKYLLKVLYIGFENKLITVDVAANPVDLGDISLKESNVLSEVVITSKTPPFRSSINGGIIANVSTTLLSSVGTANDVLQRMPGIAMDNNKITVFGKGAPIVYINNRKVRDNQELERLESSEISTIELITNPGAKYDAEGRAVLLI